MEGVTVYGHPPECRVTFGRGGGAICRSKFISFLSGCRITHWRETKKIVSVKTEEIIKTYRQGAKYGNLVLYGSLQLGLRCTCERNGYIVTAESWSESIDNITFLIKVLKQNCLLYQVTPMLNQADVCCHIPMFR